MRKAGILMAVSSLPSKYGIGDFGPSSYEFIDLVKKSGAKLWQILPLNPLGYGNSPYQPYSSKAMDDIYISLELLIRDGLLDHVEVYNSKANRVDYDKVRAFKNTYLRLAYNKFVKDEQYESFIRDNKWIYTYAVFLTLKKHNNLIIWNEWPIEQQKWIEDKLFDITPYAKDIEYEMFLQYTLVRQWRELKAYAEKNSVEIMGDLPFYVGIDSDDVWANQSNFLLDEKARPTFIAGVPPDYFSRTGQRWGNPIYDWKYMENDHFKFWLSRFSYNSQIFDCVRIDHFRAFDTYWKIPSSSPTAEVGTWVEAPGYALFDRIFKEYPDIKIVAEDLGDMRPQVYELRDHYNFKGMKIVQFSFISEEQLALSKNKDNVDATKAAQRTNSIVYTGTHDNDTTKGWFYSQDQKTRDFIIKVLNSKGYKHNSIAQNMVAYSMNQPSEIAIIPMQDILELDCKARMNVPGTIGSPNWEWKMSSMNDFKAKIDTFHKMVVDSKR